ncbi:hypothetical protein B0H13DRAFT_1907706 [Mycena leptocephala]|nr:hypothetical protein B0H13DRAFT_1907706 [Mycena leptocephala]
MILDSETTLRAGLYTTSTSLRLTASGEDTLNEISLLDTSAAVQFEPESVKNVEVNYREHFLVFGNMEHRHGQFGADWDEEFTSKFRRSLQAEPLLPSVTQIERMLSGDEAVEGTISNPTEIAVTEVQPSVHGMLPGSKILRPQERTRYGITFKPANGAKLS